MSTHLYLLIMPGLILRAKLFLFVIFMVNACDIFVPKGELQLVNFCTLFFSSLNQVCLAACLCFGMTNYPNNMLFSCARTFSFSTDIYSQYDIKLLYCFVLGCSPYFTNLQPKYVLLYLMRREI